MPMMTEKSGASLPGGRRSRTLATLRDTAATLERLQMSALHRGQHGYTADLEERLLVLGDCIAGIEALARTAPLPRPIAPSFTRPTRPEARVA